MFLHATKFLCIIVTNKPDESSDTFLPYIAQLLHDILIKK